MGKNQSASNLTNVIQISSTGNVLFVSGSTTLMSISSSGAITTTGVISGSNALSASYAANADTLDGLDSTVFTLTSSFNAFSSSILTYTGSANSRLGSIETVTGSNITRLSSIETVTGSNITRLNSIEVVTGSNITRLNSIEVVTGSNITRLGALETATGSLYSYTSSLNLKTASFATTGSNTFIGTQTISGSVLQSGSFTTTGTIIAQTINVQTVTSSIVYSSGSNIFGNLLNNTQTFTGSVLITGSLTIAGASNATSYSGATIFGSTIACSPIGCFATSCATSFIGGALTIGSTSGTCISITTNGSNGTSASPLQTSLNFRGYSNNLNGQIRVDDISGTAQIGAMQFYTWNGGQVSALTLCHNAAAAFYGQVSAPTVLASGGCVIINKGDSTPAILQLGNTSNSYQIQYTCTGGQRLAFINGAPSEFASFYGTGVACFASTVCAGAFVGATYFDAMASSGFRIRNSGNTANVGALTRRGLWEGNANYDPGLWAETGYGLYFYTNGSATIKLKMDTSGIACFACDLCSKTLTTFGGGLTENFDATGGGHINRYFAAKYMPENATTAFFKITTSGASSTHIQLAASNAGVGWHSGQIYLASNSAYWGGFTGSGTSVSITSTAAGYISSTHTDNSGNQTFCVTVANNGTSTQSLVFAYITTITYAGYSTSFTQL